MSERMQSTSTRNKLYMALIAAFLGWMFDGMEMGIFPIVAGPALQEMAPRSRRQSAEGFCEPLDGVGHGLLSVGRGAGRDRFWLAGR